MRFWTSKGAGQGIAGENSILSGFILMISDRDVRSAFARSAFARSAFVSSAFARSAFVASGIAGSAFAGLARLDFGSPDIRVEEKDVYVSLDERRRWG